MEVLAILLGLAAIAGQVFAIIVCFHSSPAKWMKIFGAIGAIFCLLAIFGSSF